MAEYGIFRTDTSDGMGAVDHGGIPGRGAVLQPEEPFIPAERFFLLVEGDSGKSWKKMCIRDRGVTITTAS